MQKYPNQENQETMEKWKTRRGKQKLHLGKKRRYNERKEGKYMREERIKKGRGGRKVEIG